MNQKPRRKVSRILAVPDVLSRLHERLNRGDMAVVIKHVRAISGMTKRVRTPVPPHRVVNAIGKGGVFPSRASPIAAVHHEVHLRYTAHVERIRRACVSRTLREEGGSGVGS